MKLKQKIEQFIQKVNPDPQRPIAVILFPYALFSASFSIGAILHATHVSAAIISHFAMWSVIVGTLFYVLKGNQLVQKVSRKTLLYVFLAATAVPIAVVTAISFLPK